MFVARIMQSRAPRRSGLSRIEVVILAVVVVMLILLFLPAVSGVREEGRRNGCLSNIRQLALSVAHFESATRRLPVVSSATGPLHEVPPGTLGENATDSAGYNWLVMMLPYVEESMLSEEIGDASEQHTIRLYDGVADASDFPFLARQIPAFKCPSYKGDNGVSTTYGSEYDAMTNAPAIANYVSIVGTHANADGTIEENGVIVSRCVGSESCEGTGLSIKDIGDGISKTVIICETVEPIYSAWMDGQSGWVVGVDGVTVRKSEQDGWLTSDSTFLNVGAEPVDTAAAYSAIALRGGWPGAVPRHWGASSHHDGNVVLHAFADAHANPISKDVDPELYLRLITRGQGDGSYGCSL